MTRTSLKDINCSLAQTAEIVGDKWSLLIVRDVFFGSKSFSKFLNNLGIARNVLSERLDKLVKNGVLEKRQPKPGVERFTYHFTPAGEELVPVIVAMMQWGDKWVVGDQAKSLKLIDNNSGTSIQEIKLLSENGAVVEPEDIGFTPGPGAEPWLEALFEARSRKAKSG